MNKYSIICIGGSSGSISVLQEILGSFPKSLPVPVLIALHRHLESRDVLMRLLRSGGMPAVIEPFDKDTLSNGAIYIGPPNYHMMINGRKISLSVEETVHNARPSIDVLFESTAREFKERSIAVVLSGASRDGALGAQMVSDAGGQVLIQDPSFSASPTMPKTALSKVPNARCLPPANISKHILKLLT